MISAQIIGFALVQATLTSAGSPAMRRASLRHLFVNAVRNSIPTSDDAPMALHSDVRPREPRSTERRRKRNEL
jgi:hypothetical protein